LWEDRSLSEVWETGPKEAGSPCAAGANDRLQAGGVFEDHGSRILRSLRVLQDLSQPMPEGVGPRCLYDNRVREAVIARIVEDGMDVQKLLHALKRDFLLDLSEGFVYDCLHDKVEQLNMAQYRQWVVEHFSGTLCVDELHLGRYTLLLATDPLGDFPVAFALVDKNDQAHMRRSFRTSSVPG